MNKKMYVDVTEVCDDWGVSRRDPGDHRGADCCYRRDRNTGTVKLAQEQNIDNRQVPVSLHKQKRQVLLGYEQK